MDKQTTRRFMLGKTVGITASAFVPFLPPRNSSSTMSKDILTELRKRFPDKVHPDVYAVYIMIRDHSVYVVLRVCNYPIWIGCHGEPGEFNPCNELWAMVRLDDDPYFPSYRCFSPSVTVDENAQRLLDSPEIEKICTATSVFLYPSSASKGHNCNDNVER